MFKTTLVKTLLSSPAAFTSAAANRIATLEKKTPESPDIAKLKGLLALAGQIEASAFSKYQLLLTTLRSNSFDWSPRKSETDRIVIFTESLKTKAWLLERLQTDLNLNDKQIVGLDGGMSDREIMRTVESFGKTKSKIRVLVASDVASEGINLHYCAHRMFHFDMPWSLIVFQQRNGRIDRYGQAQTPEIYTMVCSVDGKGDDSNVLNHLIEREKNAHANIGDPGQILSLFDSTKEEDVVKQTMEALWAGADSGADVGTVLDRYLEQYRSDAPVPAADTPEDLDDLLFSSFGKDESTGTAAAENFPPPKPRATLFPVEEEFLSASFQYLAEQEIGVELPTRNAVEDLLELPTFRELNEWCSRVLPYELRIKGQDLPRFRFTESVERMQRAVVESRAVASAGDDDEDAELQESWPDVSFLWPLHPVSAWVTAYVASLAGTHSAFVLATTALPPGSCCFLVVAQVPNAYGEALLQGWHGVPFAADGTPLPLRTLESLIAELRLATPDLANPGNIPESVLDRLSGFRKQAIERVGQEMQAARRTFIETEKARNSAREQALSARIRGTSRQMELRLNDIRDASIRRMKAARLEQEQRERERELNDFIHWTKTNRQPEDFVHAVIVAVFVNTAPDAQEARHV